VGLGGREARPVPGREAHEAVRGRAEAVRRKAEGEISSCLPSRRNGEAEEVEVESC